MKDRNAIVTGSSHGIGKAIAIELAKNGYNVGVNFFHNKDGALDTCKQIEKQGKKALLLQADVADNQQLEDMFKQFFSVFQTIDLMVNNAGISKFYPFLEVTEEQWKEITFSDWKGAYFGTQFAARNMKENNTKGVIINISSNHVDGCWPEASIYGPTKAALSKFGKNAAMELAKYGIRVTTVAPGYTDVGWPKDHPIYFAMDKLPFKRFAEPEEVARIVAYLASDDCAYMTGNCVTIDGGATLAILPENDYQEASKC
jgi:NAD(P)-dependent dehydrogenase (short-subunit alcohol dehydrogenase family)